MDINQLIFCKQVTRHDSIIKSTVAVFCHLDSKERFLSKADILAGDHRVEITKEEARAIYSGWTDEQFNQVMTAIASYH